MGSWREPPSILRWPVHLMVTRYCSGPNQKSHMDVGSFGQMGRQHHGKPRGKGFWANRGWRWPLRVMMGEAAHFAKTADPSSCKTLLRAQSASRRASGMLFGLAGLMFAALWGQEE